MKHIPTFEQFINESKSNYKIEDFPVNTVIHFKDGEAWKVVKTGMKGQHGGTQWDEISAKPYNDLAKKKNVSLAIDFSLEYLNSNVVKLDESLNEDTLNEFTINKFQPVSLNRNTEVDSKFFASLMPKTAKTTDDAFERIDGWRDHEMFVHIQYFEVKPNGSSPDRPAYRLHQTQYWLNDSKMSSYGRKGEEINVTLLTIYDITNNQDKKLGEVYVDTKVFLDECNRIFQMVKRSS